MSFTQAINKSYRGRMFVYDGVKYTIKRANTMDVYIFETNNPKMTKVFPTWKVDKLLEIEAESHKKVTISPENPFK